MKQQLHEQNLKILRSKYKHLCEPAPKEQPKDTPNTYKIPENKQYLFTTPIKIPKHQERLNEENYEEPTERCHMVLANQERRMNREFSDRTNANRLDKKYQTNKDKVFQEFVSEREKQLTQRVQRNKRILSKSKEVREKQNRNNSVKVVESSKQITSVKDKELDRLNFLFKEKEKALISQKKAVDQQRRPGKKNQETAIKDEFTEKLKQNLVERFTKEKSKARMNQQYRMAETTPSQRLTKEPPTFQQKNKEYSIRTPIPFPKEFSPSKIDSIFANTKKIEERIHALLSR